MLRFVLATVCLTGLALGQPTPPADQTDANARRDAEAERSGKTPKKSKSTSAKHDVGSGAGDIGMGAAKGAGSAAKGTGKAALDLATLHPVNAAADLGKGAVSTGKNVGVGAVKGTGKIFKGTGKALKHIF